VIGGTRVPVGVILDCIVAPARGRADPGITRMPTWAASICYSTIGVIDRAALAVAPDPVFEPSAVSVFRQPAARLSGDRFDLAPDSSAAGELLIACHQRGVEPFRQGDVGAVIDGEIVPKSPDPAAQRRDVLTAHR